QNYPNPFNSRTMIRFDLPNSSHVKLLIYNILGQKIKTLFDGQKTAGTHIVEWDGKDSFGRNVSSGIYLYKMEAGDFVQEKKMVLLR
ncbi:MAG: T9SS type A sorting domain-containing protein, partial [Candidatus Latescibacteria bacterium]|nr:T9SS type A sorting domain-containing protein [Candidatus Latescibacterota bacterium]